MSYINKNKLKISIILLGIILLALGISFISNNEIIKKVRENGKNLEDEVTKLSCQLQINGDELDVLILLENEKGIEKVTTEDITLNFKGNKKAALDRQFEEGQTYEIQVKLVGEEKEERYIFCATARQFIKVENIDTYGDGLTKTIKIEYPENEEFTNYYSLDDGKTWQIYNGVFEVKETDCKMITLKSESKGLEVMYTEEQKTLIVADSLLNSVEKCDIKDGYYRIAIKDEEYTAHTYVKNEDVVLESNTTYGDEKDVGTSNQYAKNMVIVKVNGNLTINSGATLTAYGTAYGGPKGMLIYSSGTLTNNGTISMSTRGAYAVGQNVYLWKNADITNSEYEYVPAVGATGGARVTGGEATCRNGIAGSAGTNRRTGGGRFRICLL